MDKQFVLTQSTSTALTTKINGTRNRQVPQKKPTSINTFVHDNEAKQNNKIIFQLLGKAKETGEYLLAEATKLMHNHVVSFRKINQCDQIG